LVSTNANAIQKETSDTGQFSILLPPSLGKGSEIIFSVSGWNVLAPFDGREFGKMNLSDPVSKPIEILVFDKEDKGVYLSPATLENVIMSSTYRLSSPKPKSLSTPKSKSSKAPLEENRGTSEHGRLSLSSVTPIASLILTGRATIGPRHNFIGESSSQFPTAANTRPASDDSFFQALATKWEIDYSLFSASLNAQANLILFSNDSTHRQRALSFDFQADYMKAAAEAEEAVSTGGDSFLDYIVLAHARYKLQDYEAAEAATVNALKIHGRDSVLLRNLNLVSSLSANARLAEVSTCSETGDAEIPFVSGTTILSVLGRPFSGKERFVHTKKLSNGENECRSYILAEARDPLGRVSRELRMFSAQQPQNPLELQIFDPVAHTETDCEYAHRTCDVRPLLEADIKTDNPFPPPQAVGVYDAKIHPEMLQFSLGATKIGSLEADGIRQVVSIEDWPGVKDPVGQYTRDVWYSPALQINLRDIRISPTNTEDLIEMQEISLRPPSANLFGIPAGFTTISHISPVPVVR
jgi:hypothetical protein